jgi:hypothetical protein
MMVVPLGIMVMVKVTEGKCQSESCSRSFLFVSRTRLGMRSSNRKEAISICHFEVAGTSTVRSSFQLTAASTMITSADLEAEHQLLTNFGRYLYVALI